MQERKYDEAIVKRRIKQLLKETHTTRGTEFQARNWIWDKYSHQCS